MDECKISEILIEGCVDIRNNPIPVDEFTELFIKWIEENKWFFGGGINEYNDNK